MYFFTFCMDISISMDNSQRGLTSGRRPVVKIIAESLPQHDEKHVVPTPLSVGKGRKKKTSISMDDERHNPTEHVTIDAINIITSFIYYKSKVTQRSKM
jgi:hypothetical protein